MVGGTTATGHPLNYRRMSGWHMRLAKRTLWTQSVSCDRRMTIDDMGAGHPGYSSRNSMQWY